VDYSWNVGVTRYFDERLGLSIDGRGYYASAYVGGPNNVTNNAITNPAISQYAVLAAPHIVSTCNPNIRSPAASWAGLQKVTFPATPTTALCSPLS